MRWFVTVTGSLASMALIGLSMTINWKFGLTLGATPHASWIYGVMGVALDGLKLVIPFLAFWAWQNRSIASIIVAGLIWCGCSLISFSSAVGYSALNRSTVQDDRTTTAATRQATLKRLQRAQDELAAIPNHRPIPIVKSLVRAEKSNPRWSSTNGCTNATAKLSIAFCESFDALSRELAAAQTATSLNREIREIGRTLDGKRGAPMLAKDPQLTILARLTQTKIDTVRDMIVVALSALLELASSFGLFLTMRVHHATSAATPTDDPADAEVENPETIAPPKVDEAAPGDNIGTFLNTHLCEAKGKRVDGSDVYSAYVEWVSATSSKPVTQTRFGRWIKDHTDYRKATVGGRVRYLDVDLIGI